MPAAEQYGVEKCICDRCGSEAIRLVVRGRPGKPHCACYLDATARDRKAELKREEAAERQLARDQQEAGKRAAAADLERIARANAQIKLAAQCWEVEMRRRCPVRRDDPDPPNEFCPVCPRWRPRWRK